MNSPIIPAIMPERFDDIEAYVSMVRNHVPIVQLDLMDGNYVPEKTWPFYYGTDYDLQDLKKEDSSFPFWEDVDYELDLMISRPEEDLDTWLTIGAARVVFHYASVHDWQKIKDIETGFRTFVKIGVAVTIHDTLEDIFELIDNNVVDYVQVMGIAHIGYQGEPFEEKALGIISRLRKRYPDLMITIDGGVSIDTIAPLSQAGTTNFISGSGVYGGGIAEENIKQLESLI